MLHISPLLSVNVITYNHRKFIVETLEGILEQKTDFLFDIVICDDCSSDGTVGILEEYKKKYPDQIKLRLRNKNVGLKHNYFDNINACTGKYVAICEGDDYWTDSTKLQKQVDFLEANPAYSMCFHSALERHEYQHYASTTNIFSQVEGRDYSGEEILANWLIPTASVVLRKKAPFHFQYMDKFMFYDIVLFLELCNRGKIHCLNEVMCVYRRHPASITNSDLSYKDYIQHLLSINSEFAYRYDKIIKTAIAVEHLKQAKKTYKQRSISFLLHALKSTWYDSKPLNRIIKSKI